MPKEEILSINQQTEENLRFQTEKKEEETKIKEENPTTIQLQETELINLTVLKPSQSRGTKPFYLIFKDITYQIPISKDKSKTVLNKVSGYFTSGQVTAIMGPSGCGKTTLLNFLTSRINFPKDSVHNGLIYLNSEEIEPETVSEYSSYVMQDDVLMETLTPTELFTFIAKLKADKTEEEYKQQVQEIIDILKINKCKDTRIGSVEKKGLSGGEKKRVSIGCEIISNPSILFLDEPTSGLDSATSEIVITFLKELASIKNMIIAFSIHQPSSNIVNLFDKVLIINKGELVYQGSVKGNDSDGGIISYFDKEIEIPLETKSNPSDAFMHVIEEQKAGIDGTHEIETIVLKGKKPLTELYKEKRRAIIEKEINSIIVQDEKCLLPKKNSHKVSYFKEFNQMLWRSWTCYIRNPKVIIIKTVMTLVFTFFSLSIFWSLDNDYQGAYDKAGFLFFFSLNNLLSILFDSILVFPQERVVFLRDYSNQLYGVSSYYLSKNIVETPLVLINAVLFGVFIYHEQD